MQRFPQEALASAALAAGLLQSRHMEVFARQLAVLHDSAPRSDGHSPYGAPAAIRDAALQNFDQLQPLLIMADDVTALAVLRDWTLRELTLRQVMMRDRHAAGTVREGHGDLHLGNIVLIDDRLVPFDCIEFNVELRWNDIISEVAFLVMDLHDRGSPQRAWLFLNAWLEQSGDYAGIVLLPFYLVYRAMVRAKVHALRAAQSGVGHAEHARLMGESRKYIALARHFAHGKPPALIITHGLSGSGKSRIAGEVMQQLGAIRIRSDVERKRLHGLLPHERSASSIGGSIYNDQATQALYHHLASLARTIIAAGYTVIVDATFLKSWQRDCLRDVARDTRVPFLIMSITAPDAVLRTRIRQREAAGNDPSDAGIAVLEHQLQSQEALSSGERPATIMLSSNSQSAATCSQKAIEFLAARTNN